jgi:hypothetical protein
MSTAIDATVRHGYERMAGDFQRVFGDRFVALVASPGGAAAAFVAAWAPTTFKHLAHSRTRGGGSRRRCRS